LYFIHDVCMFVALDKNLADYKVLLQTVYAEAGGEGKRGQVAVAWVIKNRLDARNNKRRWGGDTIATICQASFTNRATHKTTWQFSCWANRKSIAMPDKNLRASIEAWLSTVYCKTADPTNGSNSYYAFKKIKTPKWAKDPKECPHTVDIGGHRFYKCK